MTANDLGTLVRDPAGIALQFNHTARSLVCSQDQLDREARPKARAATPLSSPTRSAEAIMLSEESYLPRRRFRRSEHSLTREAEKCDLEREKNATETVPRICTPPRTPFQSLNFCPTLLIPCASLLTVSRTLNFLFKVLFIFPSRYLFAIGLVPIFSFRRSLPPVLGCIPKQPDSEKAPRGRAVTAHTGFSPSMTCRSKQLYCDHFAVTVLLETTIR